MKVYIVIGDNNERYEDSRHWNDAVFTSREAAERYIQNQPEIYYGEQNRIDELEELKWDVRELDEDEEAELRFLKERWSNAWRCCPSYRIEEMEVFE